MPRYSQYLLGLVLLSGSAFSQVLLEEPSGWLSRAWSEFTRVGRQVASSVLDIKPVQFGLSSVLIPLGSQLEQERQERRHRLWELSQQLPDTDLLCTTKQAESAREEYQRLLALGNSISIQEDKASVALGLEQPSDIRNQVLSAEHAKVAPEMILAPGVGGPAPQPEPLPAGIRQDLPDAWIPWWISKRVFEGMQQVQNGTYKKSQVLPTDPEWRFIWRCFYHDKPTKWGLGRVYCVHRQDLTVSFESNLARIEDDAANFPATWNQEPRSDQRVVVMDRWKRATGPFSPFQTMARDGKRRTWEKAKVLPVWHGSQEEYCHQISNSGFTFFGKVALSGQAQGSTDDGYFGSGIYFTNSARYLADIYSHGHLLMSWVSMSEPFPVVGDSRQQDMEILRGKGAYKRYNAHYVPVVPGRLDYDCAEYYPCQEGQAPVCDKLVVFQRAQALPRYWVELQVEHPAMGGLSQVPVFVEDLIPVLMGVLQHSQVDRDKKLRNVLNRHLERLLQRAGDDYLEDKDSVLYSYLTQLIDGRGQLDVGVSRSITRVLNAENERRGQIFRQEQQSLQEAEQNFRSQVQNEESAGRGLILERGQQERKALEDAKRQAEQQAKAPVASNRPGERVARTQAMRVDPLKRSGDWYKGPREAKEVKALEWELGRKGSKLMPFKEAQAYAASRSIEGWRLPSIWELEALCQQKSALGDDFDGGWFWSDTAVLGRDGYRWDLSFEVGQVHSYNGRNFHQVRLVRG